MTFEGVDELRQIVEDVTEEEQNENESVQD